MMQSLGLKARRPSHHLHAQHAGGGLRDPRLRAPGAVHSVVFGGFAAASLAARIDDARPALMITADGGSRAGKVIPYKPLVDESIRLAKHPPPKVLIFNRGLDPDMPLVPGRDVDWKDLFETKKETVDCVWLDLPSPPTSLYVGYDR
jgi:propionyl-CoA synthetase